MSIMKSKTTMTCSLFGLLWLHACGTQSPGSALLGDNDSRNVDFINAPTRMRFVDVRGRDYQMQETEVTRGQWKDVMSWYPEDRRDDCQPTVKEDNHPVSCVSAHDAEAYARKLTKKKADGYTYRLPTDEEWLHAAGEIVGNDYGWCDGNSDGHTHAVRQLKSHNWLYDMVGNVYEWTSSTDGSIRVLRGGGWHTFDPICSSAHCIDRKPDVHYASVGFRLLRKLQ